VIARAPNTEVMAQPLLARPRAVSSSSTAC